MASSLFNFKKIKKLFVDSSFIAPKGIPHEELFPYACYYNKNTIITHNGHLLQTMKISSYLDSAYINLFQMRETINKALKSAIKKDNINYYITTIRKKTNIIPKNQTYRNNIINTIIEKWNNENKFNDEYINEIYITVVICDKSLENRNFLIDLLDINLFLHLKKKKYLEFKHLHKELEDLVKNITEELVNYKPKILSIVEQNGFYFSEHCKFFSTIINNDRRPFPLDINNLGYGLANKKIIYGSNLIQSQDEKSKINTFYSLVSLKNISNILLSEIDKIVQIHQELIITQSLTIIAKTDKINQDYKEQANMFIMVEEDGVPGVLNIGEIIKDSENKKSYNFFLSQTLIQIKGSTIKELEINTANLIKILKNLGIVCVREEMFMPTLFWSQLPGNFDFIKRQRIIHSQDIGVFASLCNFPTGQLFYNKWGDATIILRTALKNPYFFSFHSLSGSNTLIVGAETENRTKLLNFFTMASSKQIDKLFYIDTLNKSRLLINVLNGKYFELNNNAANVNKNTLQINIFELAKTPENITLILNSILKIVKLSDDGMIKLGDKKTSVEDEIKIFTEKFKIEINNINNIEQFLTFLKTNNFNLVLSCFEKFNNENMYKFIFNKTNSENIFTTSDIACFDLSNCINNDLIISLATIYILKSIYDNTDEKLPTLVVINEIWNLFDNKYIGLEIHSILEMFKKKNITILASTNGSQFFENSFIKESVRDIFPVNILLRNLKTNIYQKKIFGITEQESKMLSVIKKDSGTFLLKHNNNLIFTSILFDFLSKTENIILDSDNIANNIMLKAQTETNSKDSTVWFSKFEEISEKYNKMKYDLKLKQQEERQIKWQESREQINMDQINGAK